MVQGTASKLLEDEVGVIGVTYKQEGEQKVIGGVSRLHSKEVYAPLTIVCDGCFSNFRSKFGLDKPSRSIYKSSSNPFSTSHFVGLIMKNCTLPYPQHGHVFLLQPGPVLCYQVVLSYSK